MPGKRQHYVPKFLLRRFSDEPTSGKGRLFRLDKRSGQPRKVSPVNEVVIGRYYRLVDENGNVDDTADQLLDRIEARAAEVVARIEDPGFVPSAEEIFALVLFVVTLKTRTPQAREALRENDERIAELMLELLLSDERGFHSRSTRDGRAREEIEADRVKALSELHAGRIGFESSESREIALMFLGLEDVSEKIFEELGVTCVRIRDTDDALFVLSDHPVSHFDPTPKAPDAGASFISSPNSVTFVPLDPKFGLLWTQEAAQSWRESWITGDDVAELNLLTYAWAREAVYGPTQESVTRLRRLAKRQPQLLAKLRYRPPRIWISDLVDEGPQAGAARFTSRFRGQSATELFHVPQDAIDEAERNSWSPYEENSDEE